MLLATENQNLHKFVKTHLAATLAHMRLLASVHARMHSQSTALNELLATAGVITHMRSDTAVNAL